jgi:hypothetical protein
MTRRAAAVVLALTFNPAVVSAQDTVFTVTVPSADVYKGPTTVTPVVGRAARGTVLPVTRNLGSWAKVAWPDAPDGIGYVHLTMGRLASSKAGAAAASAPARTPVDRGDATATMPLPEGRNMPRDRMAVIDQSTGQPVTHTFGVGGQIGSTRSVGATARVWRNDRVGLQFSFMRDAMTSGVAAGRVTSMQLEPAAMYALFDHVSDYVWMRPYVGSGLSFHHQRLQVSAPELAQSSNTGFGLRVFAGSELWFSSVPRFGLSVEFGYRRVPTPFPGFEANRLSASLAGHWYVK